MNAMDVGAGGIIASLVVLWVLSVIAYWRLFTKAGEPGWKSIIPIYSTYMVFLSAVSSMAAAVVMMILYVIVLILSIVLYVKMSKAYGKGGGFAVGLLLLWPIFILILGFGSSEYLGPQA